MSLIKKADFKNRVSRKTGVSVFPFGLKRANPAPTVEGNAAGVKTESEAAISQSSPISPEVGTSAQGSIGTPDNAARSGARLC